MKTTNIIERMTESPLVWDGAMGTMIYARGVYINRCFDEMSLSSPDLIRDIHTAYVAAGADVIETNTFGANRIWLSGYGLGEQTAAINRAAAELARATAGDALYVAGSVGPCLRAGEQLLTRDHRETVRDAFRECTEALAAGGVDCFILETFSDAEELLLAAETAALTGLPVAASFAVDLEGKTARGVNAETMVETLDRSAAVQAIGMNCGTGPAPMYTVAQRVLPLTQKPFLLMPNAGQPESVGGRTLYLATPEYFTEYAKRFITLGARGVGGCCGTTPEHIREVARAVHAMSGVKPHLAIRTATPEAVREIPLVPMADKSALGRNLAAGRIVTSVEILPPHSCDLSPMLEKVRRCREAGVDAINIPDGPRASVRISPMITALAVQQQGGIEPVLHYCCRDRNLIGMQSDLLGAYAAGIRNVLIVTGDPPKLGDYPDATGVFDVDAIGLTQVVHNLNRGFDVGGNHIDPPCGILIGVGVNPCAIEMEREIERYRHKIEAGAEFAITQPIFDAETLFRFLDRIENFPKRIPVIAGIWPLVSFKNAEFMKNEVPGVEVPDAVVERMRRCKTREDGIREGIAIARDIRDRVAASVAGFQVSAPFGKVELAIDVLAGAQ